MGLKLTDREKGFLKQYALKYGKERKIDITADPIVVVEVEREIVTQEGYHDRIIYAWEEDSYDTWESLEVDLMDADYSPDDIEEIKEELENESEALEGSIRELPVVITREPVAYFLTREEAEKYCKHQKHNLRKPRVYSRYVGYGNNGDLECLMKLLLRAGKELLESEGSNES